MSAQLPTTTRSAKPTNLVQIGKEVLKIRLEDGYMRCALRTVRLYLGTELYFAGKAPSKASDKINTQQAGYMKEVAARGGILMCPPQIDGRPNPEIFPDGRVKATAVCIVRDNLGNQHFSRMSYIQDSQLVLRQELLNIESPDIVQILSDEDAAADRESLRGWLSYPLPIMPGYKIWANARSKAVRDAVKDGNNLHATVLQRAQTKAERLCCDHNAAVRHVFSFDQLWQDLIDEAGKITRQPAHLAVPAGHWMDGAPYAELQVVFWQQDRDQAALNAMIAALKEQTEGGLYTEGEVVETGDDGRDDDGEDAPRQITEQVKGPELAIPARPEPIPVEAPAPVPAPIAAPTPAPVPAPAPVAAVEGADPTQNAQLRAECVAAEKPLPPSDLAWARSVAKLSPTVDISQIDDARLLGRYLRALKEAFGGVL
jgi:hypothetical protein